MRVMATVAMMLICTGCGGDDGGGDDLRETYCQMSDGCAKSGSCHYHEGYQGCLPETDEDCRQSRDCYQYGACAVTDTVPPMCEPGGDADCENSVVCSLYEKCTYYPAKIENGDYWHARCHREAI